MIRKYLCIIKPENFHDEKVKDGEKKTFQKKIPKLSLFIMTKLKMFIISCKHSDTKSNNNKVITIQAVN